MWTIALAPKVPEVVVFFAGIPSGSELTASVLVAFSGVWKSVLPKAMCRNISKISLFLCRKFSYFVSPNYQPVTSAL